ncbi:YkgJ family cysteine cluster protein [Nibribacter koreensis]|uniref:YkgJ family cysteine cluster protein n=1 Tax=Nibribacter koreensis TaxID=1084519 RepID=UPI0031E5C6A8
MEDSTNICLACGACCDGTLIGFVQLEHEEVPRLKEIMPIENADDIGFFLQPCSKFCNGCTIYPDRPKQCAKFECGLLSSFEQKHVDFHTAVEIVKAVRQKRVALESLLAFLPVQLKSQSFYFKMVELNRWLQKNKSELAVTKNQLELRSELNLLNSLLMKEFNVSIY